MTHSWFLAVVKVSFFFMSFVSFSLWKWEYLYIVKTSNRTKELAMKIYWILFYSLFFTPKGPYYIDY